MRAFLLAFAGLLVALPAAAEDSAVPFDGRKTVEDFWKSKGVSDAVAAGIADNTARESSQDPTRQGDGTQAVGLYQHHPDRLSLQTLMARVENDQAFQEVIGADSTAAAHWNEIKNAPDRATAARLWARYFERCARCGDPGGPPGNSGAPASHAKSGHAITIVTIVNRGSTLPATGFPSYGPCNMFPSLPCHQPAATQPTAAPRAVSQPVYTTTQVFQASPRPTPAVTYRQPIIQSSAVLALASFFHRRR